MFKSNDPIWFWQRIQTPHMGALAAALAKNGHKVYFIANNILSKKRIEQGWEKARLGNATFKLVTNKDAVIRLAKKAPKNSIHLCQGLHNNGLVNVAQKILKNRGLNHWVIMEKINEEGFKGKFKKLFYRLLFIYWKNYLQGVLAIGHGTRQWIIERGIESKKIYSFAYFLDKPKTNKQKKKLIHKKNNNQYRFLFVGQLIARKRVELLISAIAALKLKDIELWIVGDGPEKENLYSLANLMLPHKVYWHGTVKMSKISGIIKKADCLVLPSRHDGWGAVTSESLIVGTPVICSNTCGSSVTVKASSVGGVFLSNNKKSLIKILHKQYKVGKISCKERQKIVKWAKCLGVESGAKYLKKILWNTSKKIIYPPWKSNR